MVQFFLEQTEIDTKIADRDGNTGLDIAIRRRDLEIVKLLLERSDIDASQKNKYSGDTPLHVAVRDGCLNIVQYVMTRTYIDPNEQNQDGDTLLHKATKGGHLDIVQFLLENPSIEPTEVNKVCNVSVASTFVKSATKII
ncbi:Hypothetical predicted protein [Mytilus galloprovincialis]|uniref:Uncharacterized protein n=1 Tax=Mytilus galloprovincialis TaxID=29158 RepID=A0A8B6C527_MYTGA|nr:Hypothetical predicted protein [Mytilus galloprovincialis]